MWSGTKSNFVKGQSDSKRGANNSSNENSIDGDDDDEYDDRPSRGDTYDIYDEDDPDDYNLPHRILRRTVRFLRRVFSFDVFLYYMRWVLDVARIEITIRVSKN